MRVLVLCILLLCLAAVVQPSLALEERVKRDPHLSKLKVKIVSRGPLGLRKHKYRYRGHGGGHGLGHYGHGYGQGYGHGYGGYGGHGGLGSYGGGSSFASSFSSPFGNFATAAAHAAGKR